jgi:hypothetical protein
LTENKELEEFVRSACISLQKGVTEGLEIIFPIEFEIAVVSQKNAGAGLKLIVAYASGKYAKEEMNKIKFKIGQPIQASSGKGLFS